MNPWLKRIVLTAAGLSAIGALLFLSFNKKLPEGERGEAADLLARRVLAAVNVAAWGCFSGETAGGLPPLQLEWGFQNGGG